ADSVRWIFGDAASGAMNRSANFNPLHFFSTPGNYTVKLTGYRNHETDTIEKIIHIAPCDIEIPNVISPNNDGINDFFIIKGMGSEAWKLIIYSRWGEK